MTHSGKPITTETTHQKRQAKPKNDKQNPKLLSPLVFNPLLSPMPARETKLRWEREKSNEKGEKGERCWVRDKEKKRE